MIAIRRVARREPPMPRDDFIKELATELGYRRVGSNIRTHLSGHIRAAVRRDILENNGGELDLATNSITDYTRDELIDAITSVMRKRSTYEREEVIRAVANHYGFKRVTQSIRKQIKSAINGAIRRDIIERAGSDIRRT